jgi:hypothetical protein
VSKPTRRLLCVSAGYRQPFATDLRWEQFEKAELTWGERDRDAASEKGEAWQDCSCGCNFYHRLERKGCRGLGASARTQPACAPDRPRTSVWSGFWMQVIQNFVGSRETFQSWPGSKVITTRPFRPNFQDGTPDVPERADFSSLRSTQQTGISREDSCPNAGGVHCRSCSCSSNYLLVLRLHAASPNGDSNALCGPPR